MKTPSNTQAKLTRKQQKLVEDNRGLVYFFVRMFVRSRGIQGGGEFYYDLLSEGFLALVKAAKRFDPDKGFAFSTYAGKVILRSSVALAQKEFRFNRGLLELKEDLVAGPLLTGCPILRAEKAERVREAVRRLPPRERKFIWRRFGLGKESTGGNRLWVVRLDDLRSLVNVTSREGARLFQKRALKQLREDAPLVDLCM